MNKTIICIFLLSLTSISYAEKKMTKNDMIEAVCGDASEFAQQVMQQRQSGETITNLIKNTNSRNLPEPKNSFYKSIIYNAYKVPVSSDSSDKKISSEYSNHVFMTCSEEFTKVLSE